MLVSFCWVTGIIPLVTLPLCTDFCHDAYTLKILFTSCALHTKEEIVVIYEEYVWITKHKTICLSHTQRHTQHKIFKARTIKTCSIAQVIPSPLFKSQIMTSLLPRLQLMPSRNKEAEKL